MRNIEKKMVQFIDERLATNGLAQHAIKTKNPRQLFIEAVRVCVGITEKSGRNDGPMVELIQETIGIAEGEAWCCAFVQTGLAYVEVKLGVKSPIVPTEGVLDMWQRSPTAQHVLYLPLPGAIICWQHGTSWQGHTGIVLGADWDIFTAVEGNTTSGTDPNGKIVRDGGGVHFTNRSMKGNGDMRILGFLKPF